MTTNLQSYGKQEYGMGQENFNNSNSEASRPGRGRPKKVLSTAEIRLRKDKRLLNEQKRRVQVKERLVILDGLVQLVSQRTFSYDPSTCKVSLESIEESYRTENNIPESEKLPRKVRRMLNERVRRARINDETKAKEAFIKSLPISEETK